MNTNTVTILGAFFLFSTLMLSTSLLMAESSSKNQEIKISTKGGLNVSSGDGAYKFNLGGFFQWDYDQFDGLYNDDTTGSESKLRRARLIFKGSVPNNYHYVLMSNYNNATKSVELLNAFMKYTGAKYFDFTVGRFKEPFGMELLSSAKWLPTIERSVILNGPRPLTAGTFIDSGVMFSRHRQGYTWALAFVDDRVQDRNGRDSYAVTGRFTYAPINHANRVLHLGAAYSDRGAEAGTTYTLNEQLGVNGASKTQLFNTTIDDLKQAGLELAFQHGPFSLQSEYIMSRAEGDAAGVDVDLDSYYLILTYTLTGEPRIYSKGVFGVVKPKANGAVELVAKFDSNEAEITGAADTRAEILTLGVNYYVNQHVKLAANYVMAETDNLGEPDEGDAISARLQFVF